LVDIVKNVLFVCVENSCRSQMAEGFAQYLGKNIIKAYSAGSNPLGKVNSNAKKVMKEIGVDISKYRSKGFNELPIEKFDIVVAMGCADICPFVPASSKMDWKLEDPKDKDMNFFRKTRDKIKDKVAGLIQMIAIEEKINK